MELILILSNILKSESLPENFKNIQDFTNFRFTKMFKTVNKVLDVAYNLDLDIVSERVVLDFTDNIGCI